MQRICLNAIVRNEVVNLPRMLNSMVGHITAMVILDTGSTDGSQAFIHAFCQTHKIQCRVIQGTFKNFEQARNDALDAARRSPFGWDYLLLCDADMELRTTAPLPPLTAECYSLVQRQGGMAYYNARLLRRDSPARYHGVTHEYLSVNEQVAFEGEPWWFLDHATGSNRGDKYERDTKLLEGYLAGHTGDGRSLFYLAQTYRDRGLHEKAIDLYQQRIAAGGWDEEVWYSRLQIARSFRALGNIPGFILSSLDAYNARPSRAEPLYDLARFYRDQKDQQQTGWLFAKWGASIPYPKDLLFVEQWVYDWGFMEELSILGAYNDKNRDIGFDACDKLSLMKEAAPQSRENARRNLFWYLLPLKEIAPSFTAVKIPQLNMDPVYTNTNPSVAVVDGKLKAIIRTVSYRIRSDGTYDYNGLQSIRTTSYLADFTDDFQLRGGVVKINRPTGFPDPVTTDVLDVEDLRLIPHRGELWANGCVLEQNDKFWREQFLMKINPDTGECTDWRRVDPQGIPKQNEKNWMPLIGSGCLQWMYRPGWVMYSDGQFPVKNDTKLAVDQFSGGGQVVSFDAGYLAIVHEARPDPTNGKRFYQHRFVWFDGEYVLQKVSRPFVFFDRQIEFAAGLALHNGKVIVSFGVLDREAWLASISEDEVRHMVWHP
jgi:glycosyltransferase involved in cell wall biosynthesis